MKTMKRMKNYEFYGKLGLGRLAPRIRRGAGAVQGCLQDLWREEAPRRRRTPARIGLPVRWRIGRLGVRVSAERRAGRPRTSY